MSGRLSGRLSGTDGSSPLGQPGPGVNGQGQGLPWFHVGWIKSPPGAVAGGPQEDSATLGQLPAKSPSLDHRAQILEGQLNFPLRGRSWWTLRLEPGCP